MREPLKPVQKHQGQSRAIAQGSRANCIILGADFIVRHVIGKQFLVYVQILISVNVDAEVSKRDLGLFRGPLLMPLVEQVRIVIYVPFRIPRLASVHRPAMLVSIGTYTM